VAQVTEGSNPSATAEEGPRLQAGPFVCVWGHLTAEGWGRDFRNTPYAPVRREAPACRSCAGASARPPRDGGDLGE
jgi:hypothetical protein